MMQNRGLRLPCYRFGSHIFMAAATIPIASTSVSVPRHAAICSVAREQSLRKRHETSHASKRLNYARKRRSADLM